MAFFSEEEGPLLDRHGERRAKTLAEALLAKGVKVSARYKSPWSVMFARLASEKEGELIDRVLDWYCKHIGERYIPEAHSASSFRSKFDRLVEAMGRDTSSQDEGADDRSKKQAGVFLAGRFLPPEVAGRLPQIIQKTRAGWDGFLARLKKWRASHKPTDRGQLFLGFVLDMHGTTFVSEWLLGLHDRFHRDSHFHGGVGFLAFHDRHPWFKEKFWWDWSQKWSSQPNTFDSLLEDVLKGDGT